MGGDTFFNRIAESLILTLTHTVNFYSGILQLSIYLLIFITFGFALIKMHYSFKALLHCSFEKIKSYKGFSGYNTDGKTPLAVIAAGVYIKARQHYLRQSRDSSHHRPTPPDTFVRDAAFQFSERYFESKFLEPMGMLASLLPPLGFIGTIIGMVIHFLSNTGDLKSGITIIGIATALYTTFIGLIFYTFLEFIKRYFYTLAQKRIEEGLAAASKIEDVNNLHGNNET